MDNLSRSAPPSLPAEAPETLSHDQLLTAYRNALQLMQSQQDEKVNFSARVPKVVASEFRHIANIRGIKVQDATTIAMREWTQRAQQDKLF